VLLFWPTPGNTNFYRHIGRRFYGGLAELRELVFLPAALRFLEDDESATAEAGSLSATSGARFARIPLQDADEIPVHIKVKALDFGWGHP